MKTRLTEKELTMLANAYLLNKLFADELKEVKTKVKTDELASTVVGEHNGKSIHKPYKVDGVVEVQVIDSNRESIDTVALTAKLAEYVDKETLNRIVEECTKRTSVHTVNIKPDKDYSVEFAKRIRAGLALLDRIDDMKNEVRQKVLAMINKASAN